MHRRRGLHRPRDGRRLDVSQGESAWACASSDATDRGRSRWLVEQDDEITVLMQLPEAGVYLVSRPVLRFGPWSSFAVFDCFDCVSADAVNLGSL